MFWPMPLERPCPQCGKLTSLAPENTHRPFCSDRCRLIDLGEWASEGYRVPVNEKSKDFDAEKEIDPESSEDPH